MDVDERRKLARTALETLDGYAPESVRTLAAGLRLAGGDGRGLADALESWADRLEDPDTIEGSLAELVLASWLRRHRGDDELRERLGRSDEAFPRALSAALETAAGREPLPGPARHA